MLILEEAFSRMMEEAAEPGRCTVGIHHALGRVLAAPIGSPMDLPPFSNSAMDGFAVRARDTAGAAADHPLELEIAGESAAGRPFEGRLEQNCAIVISTGAKMPEGADAVIPIEKTRKVGDDRIEVRAQTDPARHVRFKGEDVKAGDRLAGSGSIVDPAALALLCGAGVAEAEVFRTRKVAICATGTELEQPGAPLEEGKIYESSTLMLRSLMHSLPVEVTGAETVEDDPDRIRSVLGRAMEKADVLCVCGGVSVGRHDHVKRVFKALGVKGVFWRVRIKPGKPIYFGVHSAGWVFGIPGNPISTLCGFVLFIEPFLRAISGCSQAAPLVTRARLTAEVSKKGDRRTFLTARVFPSQRGLAVQPISGQGSGMLHSMQGANCFVVLPEECMSVVRDEEVEVVLMPSFRAAGFFEAHPDER